MSARRAANGGANEIHVYDGATDARSRPSTAGSSTAYVGTQTYLAINETTNRIFASNFDQTRSTSSTRSPTP